VPGRVPGRERVPALALAQVQVRARGPGLV